MSESEDIQPILKRYIFLKNLFERMPIENVIDIYLEKGLDVLLETTIEAKKDFNADTERQKTKEADELQELTTKILKLIFTNEK